MGVDKPNGRSVCYTLYMYMYRAGKFRGTDLGVREFPFIAATISFGMWEWTNQMLVESYLGCDILYKILGSIYLSSGRLKFEYWWLCPIGILLTIKKLLLIHGSMFQPNLWLSYYCKCGNFRILPITVNVEIFAWGKFCNFGFITKIPTHRYCTIWQRYEGMKLQPLLIISVTQSKNFHRAKITILMLYLLI